MTYTDDELAHACRVDGFDCPFCWGTGRITVNGPGGTDHECPCPEGCTP